MEEPSVLDFEKIVEYRNKHNRFARKLGIVVESVGPGTARVVKTVQEDDLNPIGWAHGGVYFTMADSAAGSAMVAKGFAAVTLNASYNFFRGAAVGDTLTAEATEVKTGKTICVFDVRVTDQRGTLLGTGTFTFFQTAEPIQI